MTMRDLAKQVIAVADNNGTTVTNLQLQKVMYFSIQRYLDRFGNDAFIQDVYNEHFVTWPYGPVVPNVYFEFNTFGNTPIQITAETNPAYDVFNDDIRELLNEDVFELVQRSHNEQIWASHRNEIVRERRNFTYTLETIENPENYEE